MRGAFARDVLEAVVAQRTHVDVVPEVLSLPAVILAGPWIGLILMWRAPRAGAWLIALTMAGALVFGIINHFVLDSPDHYSHVSPEWRSLFTSTAISLAITKALGSGLAIRLLNGRRFL